MRHLEGNLSASPVSADIAAKVFVGFDGELCAAGAKAQGVSLFAIPKGSTGPIQARGVAEIIAGDTLTVGEPVMSDSLGHAIPVAAFAAAAPGIAWDASKLTIPDGAVPVLSTAAHGALIDIASGFLTPAAPVLSGGALPVAINGYVRKAAAQGETAEIWLV